MSKDEKGYIVLIAVMVILLIVYMVYVILDERNKLKKYKYYKSTVYYETDWGKYNEMVIRQKKIIFKKKFQLLFLQTLVFLKGLVVWK